MNIPLPPAHQPKQIGREEGARRWLPLLRFALLSFGVLLLAGAMITASTDSHMMIGDFRNYWMAFEDVRLGKAIYLLNRYQLIYGAYLYPPPLAAFSSPLVSLSCSAFQQRVSQGCMAGDVWNFTECAFFVAAILVLMRALGRWNLRSVAKALGLAGLFFPVYYEFGLGQIDMLLLLCLSLVIVGYATGHEYLAGPFLGLAISIQLFPAVIVAYFVWRRQWRLIGSCLAAVALLVLASGLIASWQDWAFWLQRMVPAESQGLLNYAYNWSPSALGYVAAGELGFQVVAASKLAHLVGDVLALALLAAAYLSWRRHSAPSPARRYLEVSILTLLALAASPVVWSHHLLLALPLLAGLTYVLRTRASIALAASGFVALSLCSLLLYLTPIVLHLNQTPLLLRVNQLPLPVLIVPPLLLILLAVLALITLARQEELDPPAQQGVAAPALNVTGV